MARGRASKATKKFESKHLSKVLENRKIQKRNKDKYSKNKVRNDARTTEANAIVHDELVQKKAVANGKGSIFDGMTMDEFLEGGGGTAGKEMDELEASHRAGLEGLKEKDPSFYEFLKKNDRELLEFDPDDMEEEMDVDEEEEEDKATLEGGLTQEVLAKWEKLLVEEKSLGTLKKVLIAVRSAAANVTGGEESSQTGNAKYILTDPEAFDRLLLLAYTQTPTLLQHHVPVTEKNGKLQVPSQNKKSAQIVPLLKSLFHSTLVLLPNLSSPPTTLLVLSQTEKLLPYITGFRKLVKQLITSILDIWSRATRSTDDGDDSSDKAQSEEQDAVRIAAFLWIRKVMFVGDRSLKEICLKTSYAAFVKNARVTTAHTLPHLNFLKNSLSELYGFDQHTSYQHAFTYIRQLAIHLRNSMTSKTAESTRIVYCWQYIHSLDFFSRMLSQHVGSNPSSPLQPLIYPCIQVTLGTIKLNPSSQYFPLRFHLLEALLRLSRQTGVYIPIAPTLLEPLDAAVMKSSSKKKVDTVMKPVELEFTLKVSSTYLSGPSARVYRDQVANKLVSLLAQFFDLHAQSPAFPELTVPPIVWIKKWVKKNGEECGPKVRHALSGLVGKLEEHAKWVEEKRKGMVFEPEHLSHIQVGSETEEGPFRKWIKKQSI